MIRFMEHTPLLNSKRFPILSIEVHLALFHSNAHIVEQCFSVQSIVKFTVIGSCIFCSELHF
jgi:hypothetical protein